MNRGEDSKFIQEFQTKLDDMTNSNSTVNQKILSDLQDIKGKVSTILGNIKSLNKKIVECDQKTNTVNKQIQQNNQSMQSSAPSGQIAELQKQNADLKQQLTAIDQTKKQAIDAIQKSIVVLDNYRSSSNTDVNSIKVLIDDIKAVLSNASTAATTSGESNTGFFASIFGSTADPLVPAIVPAVPAVVPAVVPAAQVVQEQGPSDLERSRADETEKQKRREDERTRELSAQSQEQQIIGDRRLAQGIENMQRKIEDSKMNNTHRQINTDEQLARNFKRQEPYIRGGKKTRKSKKRSGNNKSKRRHKKRSPKKH